MPLDQSLQGLRIMIVEDMLGMADDLVTLLYRAGASTVDLMLGMRRAQRRLAEADQQQVPHLVLIDHALGAHTGTELARWMAQQGHLQTTIRVSFSGAAPDEILRGVPEHHWPGRDQPVFHSIVTKPVPFETLKAKLAGLCGTRM